MTPSRPQDLNLVVELDGVGRVLDEPVQEVIEGEIRDIANGYFTVRDLRMLVPRMTPSPPTTLVPSQFLDAFPRHLEATAAPSSLLAPSRRGRHLLELDLTGSPCYCGDTSSCTCGWSTRGAPSKMRRSLSTSPSVRDCPRAQRSLPDFFALHLCHPTTNHLSKLLPVPQD
eukprot:1138463-Rhodomonas_salina.1